MVTNVTISRTNAQPPAGGTLDPHAAALAYAALGWSVLPIRPRTKVPLTEHGLDDATTDRERIGEWWRAWPDAGVGIALAPSGLVALDIDPRHDGDIEALPPHPPTLTARTGGGGWHLLFRAPTGASFPGRVGRGLDVKHKGYIVAEPSVHPSGHAYCWQDWTPGEGEPEIPEAPAWLRRPAEAPRNAGVAPEPGGDTWGAGRRNERLSSEAYRWRKQGRTVEQIAPVLVAMNEAWCEPPLPEAEVREIARRKARVEPEATAVEPVDIFRAPPVPSFTEDCVPPVLWRLAKAFAASSGFDPNGAILAGAVAAAAAIDDRYRLAVRPDSDWFESARLWGVVIGPPSAGKTPMQRAVTAALKELHTDLVARWARDNPAEAGNRADAPPRPAIFTSDATVEKLADLLMGNPRGMLMLTEEFDSWIGSHDAYRDGAGSRDRGEWLQLYDGGPHQIDRVRRGSMLIPNWGCSVLAATTPAGLRRHAKSLPDDGLIQRVMPVLVRSAGDEGAAGARGALDEWSRRLRAIFDETTTERFRVRARISTNAQALFDAERREIRQAIDALSDLSPALAGHIGKHPGMIARLALTFHVLDGRAGDAIEADTMRAAIAFLRIVRRHAAAMFGGVLSVAPAVELCRQIARSIVADESEPAAVSRATLTQRCRAFRDAGDAERRAAVALLEDCGWLTPDRTTPPYGGWPREWAVNSRVFALFGDEGARHRQRRVAIRSAITGAGE